MIALVIGAAIAGAGPATTDPCQGSSTPEVNACISGSLQRSKARLNQYLQAALNRYGEDKDSAVRLGIRASQQAFEAYRTIECDTVYEAWKEGTIRGAMTLSCEVALTDQRTHYIWQDWLQYMDSTPPILPEPKPTK